MFTFGVDFLTASLPRIPSQVVLFLYFGLAMSSTISRSFLYHVVRDRECIKSQFVELSSGFAVKSSIVSKCSPQFLDSKKDDIENIVLLAIVSHNSNNSTLPNSRIIAFESLLMGCRRYSAASRHEVLLDEDVFDPFYKLFLFDNLQHVQVSTHNVLWIRVHIRVSPYLLSL